MRTVLVVDDDRIMAALMASWLATLGYSHVSAFDVAGALNLLNATDVGVVILDLDMPGGCGLELIKHLKASSRTHSIPIIVISGHHSPSVITKVMLSGANLFIAKPTDISRVQQALSTVYPIGPVPAGTNADDPQSSD